MVSGHAHGHDGHIPERTTPQGTQEEGVEVGHEAADLNFPAVFKWFIGLVLFAAVSQVLLLAAIYFWSRYAEARDRLPSPLFGVRQAPPAPRVLPNPADSPGTQGQLLRGPGENLTLFRQQEDDELKRVGLENREGKPALPPSAAAAVTASGGSGSAAAPPRGAAGAAPSGVTALDQVMPSGPSGGTATENWTEPDDAYVKAHRKGTGG